MLPISKRRPLAGNLGRLWWVLVCLLLVWPAAAQPAPGGSPPGPARILVLTSYGAGRPGVEALLGGFVGTLAQGGVSVDRVFIENLDLERGRGEAYRRSLADTLESKRGQGRFDLAYVLEQPALDFALEHPLGLAPGAPIIVARAALPESAASTGHPFIRQLDRYDVEGTLRQALDLFPGTRRVLFVAGSTGSDLDMLGQAVRTLGPWRDRVSWSDTFGMTVAQVDDRIRAAGPETIILVLPFNRDGAGRTVVQMEMAYRVAAGASSPVFTLWQNPVGRGAVGGSVTNFTRVGEQAAQCALDLMRGRATAGSPVRDLPPRFIPMYDWAQLERWQADTARLPAQAVVINQPTGLWALHRGKLIALALFLAVQTAMIVLLLLQRRLRAQAEGSLRAALRFNELIIKHAHEGIIVYGSDLRYQVWNPFMERLTGLPAREVVGRHPLELFPFLREGQVMEHLEQVLAGEQPGPAEFHYQVQGTAASGWASDINTPLRDDSGRIIGVVGMVRDITEQKRVEEERAETARLIALVDSPANLRASVGGLTASLQRWSGCEAVGIRLDQGEDFPYFETRGFDPGFVQAENSLCVRGEDGNTLRDPTGLPVLECMCGNILRGRFDPQLPFFTAGGSFWTNGTTALLASTTPEQRQARTRNRCNGEGYESVALIPLADGSRILGLLQFNDRRTGRFTPERIAQYERVAGRLALALSQRLAADEIRRLNRDLEQRVLERTARLEAANRELEAFSYSVSHDLRTPLRSIDGFASILQAECGARLDGEGSHCLARIRAGARRMGQIIDDLLRLSRIDRTELKPEALDLSGLCRRIAEGLRRSAPGREVAVEIQPGMTAWADGGLLQAALENLLGNAWKFTAQCEQARIEAGETVSPAGARTFFIRDNGAGFDMAHADKLFGAFQRLHRPTEFEGTGVGLAIVRRIIQRHGGRVWAEAEPGRGATFSFTLPGPETPAAPESGGTAGGSAWVSV